MGDKLLTAISTANIQILNNQHDIKQLLTELKEGNSSDSELLSQVMAIVTSIGDALLDMERRLGDTMTDSISASINKKNIPNYSNELRDLVVAMKGMKTTMEELSLQTSGIEDRLGQLEKHASNHQNTLVDNTARLDSLELRMSMNSAHSVSQSQQMETADHTDAIRALEEAMSR